MAWTDILKNDSEQEGSEEWKQEAVLGTIEVTVRGRVPQKHGISEILFLRICLKIGHQFPSFWAHISPSKSPLFGKE